MQVRPIPGQWLSAGLVGENGLLSCLLSPLRWPLTFMMRYSACSLPACPMSLGRASWPQAGHSHRGLPRDVLPEPSCRPLTRQPRPGGEGASPNPVSDL